MDISGRQAFSSAAKEWALQAGGRPRPPVAAIGLLLFFAAISPALSQTSSDNDAMAAMKAAYEALPEADRRAIQDNLVWAGLYKSSVDGEFGRMTYSAMRGFTGKLAGGVKEPLPSAPARAALAARAARAKAAVGFRSIAEPRSGVTIGLPLKLFTARSETSSGAHYDARDKSAGIEIFRMREGETSLQTLYDKFRTPSPGRRVTYSVLRGAFLVVAAETPARASYTRIAKGESGNQALLRGFTISWPRSQNARYESLAVAIANSFEPFAKPGAKREAGAPAGPVITPPRSEIVASAIAFAPNRYVAVTSGGSCTQARIGARSAQILKRDPASGLTLIDVSGGAGSRLRAPSGEAKADEDVVVLFAAPAGAPGKADVSVGTGDVFATGGDLRLRAALPLEAAGGLVISRKGALLGVIAAAPTAAVRVAGAPPPASRRLIPAASLAAYLQAAGLELLPGGASSAVQSAGKIAQTNGVALEALWCLQPGGSR